MREKLRVKDLSKICDILGAQYNKRDISKLPTPDELVLLDLLNRLQEYLYNKEV